MAKSIYYPEEVKEIMDKIIMKKMDQLVSLSTLPNEVTLNRLSNIRKFKEFSEEICKELVGDENADA